jgi:type II secretory ATPase GspE/PulE/Tfp pilus assembly ATPase PilB-like protein
MNSLMNSPNVAFNSLTPAFCAANGIVITQTGDKSISFGLLNDDDSVLKTRVKKAYPDFLCMFSKMESDEFNLKLSQLYSAEQIQKADTIDVVSDDSRKSIIDRIAADAPVVNLLNSIFLEAISKRASDIHIESCSGDTVVRYRIDGILVIAKMVSREQAIALSARLKILANLNVLENRRPQDGHIDVKAESFSLDVRISIVPTVWGESIVLRLLNRSDLPLSIDSLGFSERHLDYLRTISGISSGLILVTGPTGSGKTTTLAALLKELNINNAKIISIEDPVEYRIAGITQIQIHEELNLTFDTLLRRIFRQDPDVIMIGEIRDVATAELAGRAALTGHLVFATLHTNNAMEAIYRLQNMDIPCHMIAAVLRMVIAQRLIRKICTLCKTSGCEHCSGTGYSGRTAIAEIIPVNAALSDLIAGGITVEQLRPYLGTYLEKKKFITLFDDAEEKLHAGISTESEIRRELGARQ